MARRLLFLIALGAAATVAHAQAPEGDGGNAVKPETLDVSVLRVQEKQRLLMEVRPVFAAVGWSLEWTPETQTMTARQGGRAIVMKVGSLTATVDGKQRKMPSPPRMLWERLYVPLRFATEATGCQAEYLGDAVRLLRPDGTVVMVHLLG